MDNPVVVLSGTHDFNDLGIIVVTMRTMRVQHPTATLRVAGGPGFGLMARMVSRQNGLPIETHWLQAGVSIHRAVRQRNRDMLHGADLVIGFYGPGGTTIELYDLFRQALSIGVQAWIHRQGTRSPAFHKVLSKDDYA